MILTNSNTEQLLINNHKNVYTSVMMGGIQNMATYHIQDFLESTASEDRNHSSNAGEDSDVHYQTVPFLRKLHDLNFFEASAGEDQIQSCGRAENKCVNQAVPFPWKLHEMLEAADKEDFSDVVSWLPDHKSFRVHRTEAFVNDIMPVFFRQTKYKSFQRQLNMWGFDRLLTGPNKGGYSQEHFVRGQPSLCRHMKRLKIKGTGSSSLATVPEVFETTSSTAIEVMSPQPPRVISHEDTSASVFSQGKQDLQPSSERKSPVPQSRRNAVFPNQRVRSPIRDGDIFDEGALLSVLSSVLDDPATSTPDKIPNDGDCVMFEGMQFFFVEDSGMSQSRAQRRMPIPFGRGLVRAGTRRFSLIGGLANLPTQVVSSPQEQQGCNIFPWKPAGRRFSLQRSGSDGNNGYVLKQM